MTLEEAKKRLRNAKRRAMYWSGNPSFNYKARAVDSRHRQNEKYELALCDVHSLSTSIARMEGRPDPGRRDYDPKREFGARWCRMMTDDSLKTE